MKNGGTSCHTLLFPCAFTEVSSPQGIWINLEIEFSRYEYIVEKLTFRGNKIIYMEDPTVILTLIRNN
jgi:hypothetical protein